MDPCQPAGPPQGPLPPEFMPVSPDAGPTQAPWLAGPPQLLPQLEFPPVPRSPTQAIPPMSWPEGLLLGPLPPSPPAGHIQVYPPEGIPPAEPVVLVPALLPPMCSPGEVSQVPMVSTSEMKRGPTQWIKSRCAVALPQAIAPEADSTILTLRGTAS